MKFCPNCGAELTPGAKFCTACGTPIVATTHTPITPDPMPQPEVHQPQPTYQTQEPVFEQAREASSAFKEAITGKTNIVQRVINILTRPKEEWIVIDAEQPNIIKLIGGYALILALIPALAGFIAYALIGTSFMGYSYRSFSGGLIQGIAQLLSAVAGVYLLSYIIDLLGPSFDSGKNFGKSMQLAVYASTSAWVAGILLIIPGIGWLAMIIGTIYSVFLLAVGMPVLKGIQKDKVAGYVALSVISMIVIGLVLTRVFSAILGFFLS
jgi:hypothetical protein